MVMDSAASKLLFFLSIPLFIRAIVLVLGEYMSKSNRTFDSTPFRHM